MSTTHQQQQEQAEQFDQAWNEQQPPGDSIVDQSQKAQEQEAAKEKAGSDFKDGWTAE